ncbi:thioredoxin domain-containing protein [Telmatobacter sp. DSM 110680]|uniref:Thioredoxin domain-containing protein n=1 Tax=Telmatobacter sp. DSM 110680 TaxID=3036704 RepID=A0AAU7DLX8_9BACT
MPNRLAHALRRSPHAALLMSLAAALIMAAPTARAQFSGPPPTTTVHDPAALKPPAGSRVAIVEFEDMECPDCANANPVLREAAAKYNIPWVRHDFPLPFHAWSFQAAVNARWFDTKGKKVGDDYRDQVFANQPSISNLDVLRQFTENYAKNHNIALPFAIDPQGKFAAEVKADYALGQRIGIEHTPTIWITTADSKGAPFVEVVDRTKLFQLIDQAMADTRSASAKSTSVKTAHK